MATRVQFLVAIFVMQEILGKMKLSEQSVRVRGSIKIKSKM
jgi:hypothetical protein